MKTKKISVSSLPAGQNIDDQIAYAKKVEAAGAYAYHVDIMDGKFVPNKTIDYTHMVAVKQNTNLFLDVHLMCEKPNKLIKYYAKAGANMITMHVEAFKSEKRLKNALRKIHKAGIYAGLALDLETDVEVVYPYLSSVDSVLVLAVKAGAGGQKFDESALDKVRALRKASPNLLISVDGGVNDKTCSAIWKSGADILAVGSYIYKAKDIKTAIASLKNTKG